jgi:cytochrome c-type biogenesis protein CcmH
MLSFWVLLGLLTCAATALVVWPLLKRRHAAPAPDEDARRLEVYRDRRRELERERDAGRLSAEEAARAIDELVAEAAAQFPEAGAELRAGAAPKRGTVLPWAVLSAIAVPLVAVLVYATVGSPAIVGLDPETLRGELTPAAISKAVAEIEEQVRRNPQDGEAWAMLAEARRLQDKPAEAAEAYARAIENNPPHARLLADYAETLVLLANGDFSGRPVELLAQALRIDPNDGKAVALMGAAQYRLGNLAGALDHLRRLERSLEPGSDEVARLSEAIARIEAELATRGPAGQAQAPAAAAAPAPAAPAPTAGGGTGARAAAGGQGISGTVTIDDALRAGIPAGAVLFIVARDPDGPRTPLAVVRAPAAGWPVRFSLGDGDAMDPARPLSAAARLVIEARISASGDAMRASGDPIGTSQPVTAGDGEVTVRIDRRVP